MLGRLALILLFFSSLWAQEPANGELAETGLVPHPQTSRANPLLREVFSAHCPRHIGPGARPGSADFRLREEWIDNRIDHFMRTIASRLKKVRGLLVEANRSRQLLLTDSAGGRKEAKETWVLSLRGLEGEARSIRTSIANAFPAMKFKDDLEIEPAPQSEADLYQAEMNQLESFLATAETKIHDHLFEPTHVADLGDLRGENMLTFLNRAERMAKKLRSTRFLRSEAPQM